MIPKNLLLAALCLSTPILALAQVEPGKVYSGDAKQSDTKAAAKPKTLSSGKKAAVTRKLAPLDQSKIKAPAKKTPRAPGKLPRKQDTIGGVQALPEPIAVSNPPSEGWQKLADGRWLWTGEIAAENSKGIRIHITDLKLPAGAVLRVFGPNAAEAEIDHTSATLKGKTDLWTESVFGDTARIEIVLPADSAGAVSAKITEIVNRFKTPEKAAAENADPITAMAAGACNLDVTCFPAWLNASKSVAGFGVVSGPFELLCTGTLVSDANAAAGTDYFLTANHCAPNQAEADTLEFYWLYQTAACNGPAPAVDTVPRSVGGARLIANSDEVHGNDFAFLQLNNPPPAGVTYAGWTTASPVGGVTAIHHPDGDVKKISFGNATTDDHYWQVVWSQGTTEPGSSGCPLFDANQRIIGQLLGGDASCANLTGPDVFGRFDVTFATIGNYLLNLPTTIPNNNFASSIVISGATGSIAGNSAGATKETGEPDHAANPGGNSIWYRWTAPTSGRYVFTTGGSMFDTTLAVYVGNAVDSLNQIARGDDSFELTSVVVFDAIAGTTFHIAIDGYNGQAGGVQLNWAPTATRSFVSGGAIAIRDVNTASPYPSAITINNVPGIISQLVVRLEGLQHTYLSDVGVLLRAPSGEALVLMDLVAEGANVNHNLTFHPQANQFLPSEEPLPNNASWLPTVYVDSFFSPPAPEPPYTLNLDSVFGADPNGAWNLFIEDYQQGDTGSLAGWALDISTFDNPLRITALKELGQDSVQIRWRAIPGSDYRIKFKNDLSEATWQTFDTKHASSDGESFVAPRQGTARRFYLVEKI